jgi:hypothetical protein
METELFEKNLMKIYDLSDQYSKKIFQFFSAVTEDNEERKFIDDFLDSQNLPKNKESRFSIVSRLAGLKEGSLVQFLKKEKFDEEKIVEVKNNAHLWVKDFYEVHHGTFLEEIKTQNLLPEFYREVMEGVYSVGLKMNKLHLAWNKQIFQTNKELETKFENQKEIMNYLRTNNLLDKGHHGIEADRSYSVLVNNGKNYEKKSYFEAFAETQEVINSLDDFRSKLEGLEDIIYFQKQEYLDYLDSLKNAFSEKDTNKLVSKWAEVDAKWMKITTPLQIGHPLEYYDDHYRKAVSIEWDIRLKNFSFGKNERSVKIKKMYDEFFGKIGIENYKEIYGKSIENIDRVQLFLSKPLLFFGSELNGLFSAQVVPNDMEISKKEGKKIFAFSDMILNNSREKPFTKFAYSVYDKDFVDEERKFLFNETEKFHKIYDFETIGHEYGHILWLDDDTEIVMNETGNFKNIEEFKATMGGVLSFLHSPEPKLKKKFLEEVVTRALGITAWIEEEEYRPYHCEGLIHLKGFSDAGIITFDGEKIKINLDTPENYKKIEKWHFDTYEKLARHYLDKKDATEFLNKYVKVEDGLYISTDPKVEKMRKFFYEKYQEFGNMIDESVSKKDYINN